MTTLCSQQPLYAAGWAGSIYKISQADIFVILDTVQFVPKSHQCRNTIRTHNGTQTLTIPTKGNQNQIISEVEIAGGNWQRKHLKSIEQNYSKAEYFDKYIQNIRFIYSQEWLKLEELNTAILVWILGEMGINTETLKASDLNLTGEGQDRVLSMCKAVGADKFMVGSGAKGYTNSAEFSKIGVEVEFISYECKPYEQAYEGWEPSMCGLDILLNCGQDSLGAL